MIVTKKLNIEHRFISIGGHENHDKETIQWYQYQCGFLDLFYQWVN